jgi:thiol-disulfide isomerase/thioredoxin
MLARGLMFCFAFQTLALFGADGDRTVVHLEIKRGIPAWSGQTIDFGQSRDEAVIAPEGSSRDGKAPAATVHAEPVPGKAHAYRLVIRGSAGPPVETTVTSGEPALVELPRAAGLLPYRISLDVSTQSGAPVERMSIMANYRAEGGLKTSSCQALLVVWDLTSDGVFNRRDLRAGSAVGIDLNGDGKTAGREEFVYGGEIFKFCGKNFYVDPDSLEPDGSAVTVVETSAGKPQVGSPVPSFVLDSTEGVSLHSKDWKNKVTVLDFWASWCGYCIAGFPVLREMQQQLSSALQIVSINTDEPSEMAAARKVLRDNELPWPKVMSGKGIADPVWMMFQAMEQRSLPLYVVIDRGGIIRYSGSGGEGLAELRAIISKFEK